MTIETQHAEKTIKSLKAARKEILTTMATPVAADPHHSGSRALRLAEGAFFLDAVIGGYRARERRDACHGG